MKYLMFFLLISLTVYNTNAQNVYPPSGNVGIGINSPTYKLQIITGSNTDRSIGFTNNDNYITSRSSLIYTASGNGSGIFQSAGNLLIQPRTNVARGLYFNTFNGSSVGARLSIDYSGNVGVGYKEPVYKLHIMTGVNEDRSIGFSNADDYLNGPSSLIYTASGSGSGVFQSAGNLMIQPRTSAARGIYFNTYNGITLSARLSINAVGNVGIGTTNPSNKLDVNGTIHAKEVLVDLDFPGPDYVFEEDYDLTSLEELDTYLKENKHLPEVPSAAQMKEEGVNVVEMDMLLLKKVEELTLHLIELSNQNTQLIDYNSELKSRIEKLENNHED